MKIDLERQMDRCRRLIADVRVDDATLEQLCIDTRGLLYMAEVVMTSISSIMTEDMKDLVREVLDEAAKAAEIRQKAQGLSDLSKIDKESAPRVIARVGEFDSAWNKMQEALKEHAASYAATDA